MSSTTLAISSSSQLPTAGEDGPTAHAMSPAAATTGSVLAGRGVISRKYTNSPTSPRAAPDTGTNDVPTTARAPEGARRTVTVGLGKAVLRLSVR